uniref:Ribosomal protein L6 n=1 Tax=Inkyuleea mariana TaxID=123988 RepID=A0A4D6X347_9FLOR|nr:ribosomal protein L6 [Inkyuleea mariana]
MSRIGKKIIILPKQIQAEIKDSIILITGPKGKLSYRISKLLKIEKTNNIIALTKNQNNKKSQQLYGLYRTIINNMVLGVSEGFEKKLEIQGVGYRSQMDGKNLILNIGYSHPIIIQPPKDISIKVENSTYIIISGINKELVGQIAAKIRAARPPEPYKGKGIRYCNEHINRKVGKAGK